MRSNIILILSDTDHHSYYQLLGTFSAFVIIIKQKVFVIVAHITELTGKLQNLLSGNIPLGSI